ncbi:coenzyme F420-0:L-glutamate ligase [Haploplasma axanthum]|uniref:F420-0--gamma-glutamyl ligase n=1 Tax=Haploplasma axanthum TaxID=29552 RepID=A0A449BC67_HAPAX|nr:coenzyme F420-0:L-glutamate ligase [Haploplasma axanthum]VEU80039.1 F420-0--gamma-glutamyl ligase [Haploplasma axanthum]
MKTTIARGIKTPIIKSGDDLATIVVDSVLRSSQENNYEFSDKDIIAITEAVVSISKNNYATIDDISLDVKNKFNGDHIGVVFPILSRNRFSILLRAFARVAKELTILLSYPFDEVGNGILDEDKLRELKINPYSDVISEEDYVKHFNNYIHPYTGVNMVKYYREICELENTKVNFIFSNNPSDIKKYTKNVIAADIHTRFKTKSLLKSDLEMTVYGLDDILTKPINNSGYNEKYGLLGSNTATKDKVKLFPNESRDLLNEIQKRMFEKTGKKLEVMIYGDGAFKDPSTGIWELADPVVSPSYTEGLVGSPNEIKLKFLIDNEFKNLRGQELEDAVARKIADKNNNLKGTDISLGTTPRLYTSLLGSLADLMSGSGDRGTPVVLIQNYF